jgi:predicted TIM-barrel fold metal-dependent hydrolase
VIHTVAQAVQARHTMLHGLAEVPAPAKGYASGGNPMKRLVLAVCVSFGVCEVCSAQEIDPQLMTHINSIRAIDNHAHVVAPDIEHDIGYDALRCEILGPGTAMAPANTRFGSDLRAAWKALYDFSGESDSPETLKEWQARQKARRDKLGNGYFDWVIQQAGLDIVLANRISMAPELGAGRFRWVPYDDALIFPLDNSAQKGQSPDRKILYEAEEQHLKNYMSALGVSRLPSTLDEYLTRVVGPTLEQQKKNGAVAIKFEIAYLRSLDFQPASRETAAAIYARYASGGSAATSDYTQLQDFLFRDVVSRAGQLGLVVHIHTGLGCGEYFNTRGSDPLLLEPLLNDVSLHGTRFVLLHGGSPYERHNTSIIMKPNAWVDTSVLELLFSSAELARILRPWLEMMPERIVFGTDAGPFGPGMGWEETSWIGSRKARRALGIALTAMMRDEVVTQERARAIADRVLRQNAMELYGWR